MKAMIFAAGRGERMRPLTDTCPKPLLKVKGKALIVWQIERLVASGFTDIVINHAWLGKHIEEALGDGACWGAKIIYSPEIEALETAGGIAQALPLLQGSGTIILAVSADILTNYDYNALYAKAQELEQMPFPGMHLVMVPNPDFHAQGDFYLSNKHLFLTPIDKAPRYTFANIGLYDLRLFESIAPGTKLAMTTLYHQVIQENRATGELYKGYWENVGTPEQLKNLNLATSI